MGMQQTKGLRWDRIHHHTQLGSGNLGEGNGGPLVQQVPIPVSHDATGPGASEGVSVPGELTRVCTPSLRTAA